MNNIPKYQIIITRYLNGECSFSDIRNLGNKETIKNYLYHYIVNYPDRKEEVNKIINDIDRLIKIETMHRRDYKYVEIIDEYLSEKKNIFILKKIGKKNYLLNCLNNYAFMFPEKKLEIDEIINNIDKLFNNSKYVDLIYNYIETRDFDYLLNLGPKEKIIFCLKKFKIDFPECSEIIDDVINNYTRLLYKNKYEKNKPAYVQIIESYLNGNNNIINILTNQNSKNYLLKCIDRYMYVYPEKKDKLIVLKDDIINSSKAYGYEKAIESYLSGGNVFDVLMLGDKKYIIDSLNKYALNHSNRKNEVNQMLSNIDDILTTKLDSEKLKKVMESRIRRKDTNYLNIVYDLLYNDSAIDNFIKKNIGLASIINSIRIFEKNYPNQKEEFDKLYSLYEEYKNKTHNRNNVKQKGYTNPKHLLNKSSRETLEEESNLVEALYMSNLSIEEYASNTGKSIDYLKRVCLRYKDTSISSEILNRDNKNFQKYMCKLGKLILLSPNFDVVDYYIYTSLKYSDFRDELFKLFSKNDVIEIIKKVKRIDSLSQCNVNKNIELQPQAKTICCGKSISTDEKKEIFKYLEENEMPIELYRFALNKYARGDLDFEKQKKIF